MTAYIDLSLVSNSIKLLLHDNGDGTYSPVIYTGATASAGLTDDELRATPVEVDIQASEDHIGEIGGKTILAPITFSTDTNAYSDGDLLADTQLLASCVRKNDGTGVLQSFVFCDADDQGQPFDVYIKNASTSMGTENSAPNAADAVGTEILGYFPVSSSDWKDLGNFRVACIKNIGIPIKAATGTDDLYIALVSRGTGTYTASGISGYAGILSD